MSDHSKHITHYSAADIQRYLNGQMSASEMHALEKAALDDPFLADAIEGMEEAMSIHQPQLLNQHLAEIRAAVDSKTRPRGGRVINMAWWKYAAAAIVVVVAGLFLWNIPDNEKTANNHQELAVVTEQQKADSPQVPQAAPTTAAREGFPSEFNTADARKDAAQGYTARNADSKQSTANTPALVRKLPPPSSMNYSITQNEEVAKVPIPLDTNIPARVMPEQQLDRSELANQLQNRKAELNFRDTLGREPQTEVVGLVRQQTPGIAVQAQNNKLLSNVIRGRVTDNMYKPVPFAQLHAESPANTWIADKQGYFQIPYDKKDTLMNVSVDAEGFTSQQFQLNKNIAANQLQLQPVENQMPKGVLTGGYGKKAASARAKSSSAELTDQIAEPVYGWIGFEKYLREKIRKPSGDSAVNGFVQVSFIVNRKGELSNFVVVKSLSPAADAEAVRLIKEGPSWKLKRGRKATTTVIVHFKDEGQ